MAKDHVIVCEDGDAVTLVGQDDGSTKIDVERRAVPSGYLYVDGIVGDVGQGVLRDRRNLAEEGLVVVIVTVDSKTGEVVTGPEIVTRGWVYAPEAEELLEEAKAAVLASLQAAADEGATDFDTLRRHCRRSLGKFINERTKRRPAVIPVVMEVSTSLPLLPGRPAHRALRTTSSLSSSLAALALCGGFVGGTPSPLHLFVLSQRCSCCWWGRC